jgi:hypothetical protein
MTKSHPTKYVPTEELVKHPVAKTSTHHELTKIDPSPTLLLTKTKAETIQSTTIPQADHYYHDTTEPHKISTHEPRQINPSPTLLMTMKKAETIQSTTVPQDDHYYHDMTEQAPQSSQHKGSKHRQQRPKINHPPAPKKRKENQTKKKKIKSSQATSVKHKNCI